MPGQTTAENYPQRSINSRNHPTPTLLITISVILALAQGVNAEDLSPTKCYRSPLSHIVEWTTSGVSLEHGKKILIVDTFRDQIITINQRGRVHLAPPKIPREKGLDQDSFSVPFGLPHKVRSHVENEHLLLYVHEEQPWFRIASLDQDLVLGEPFQIPTYEPLIIHDFISLGDGEILTFGNFLPRNSVPGWNPGSPAFLYFNIKTRDSKVYRTLDISNSRADENEYYYYLYSNMPFMASLNSVAYTLNLRDNNASISRIDPATGTMKDLTPISEEFGRVPTLPDEFTALKHSHEGPRQATLLLRQIENAHMPIGLYAFNKNLYLLVKDALDMYGETSWSLVSINPGDGKVAGRTRIPSRASNLTVIPGDDFWFFIEKDRVRFQGKRGAPDMSTASMTLMPSRWLTDSNSSKAWDPATCEEIQ
jgi:hypothetical protein